tara:strand:- start:2878 stop:3396 length:519 start_codon:yes stop_codon:yes gene_type:complete
MPALAEDYFGRSLMYICQHNNEGAMALLVNRPAQISANELLSSLVISTKNVPLEIPVMIGGPVSPQNVFILHTDDRVIKASVAIGKGLALTSSLEMLKLIGAGDGPKSFMITLGYSGWGREQLERELKQNIWLTCPAKKEIIFDIPLNQRLDCAANTLGINFNLIAPDAGHG